MGFSRRSYVAVAVTLTAADTNYNLLALVNAVLAAETQGAVPPDIRAVGAPREFTVQSHPGFGGVGANVAEISVGDALLSATRRGYVLTVGASKTYRSDVNNTDFASLFARSASAGQILNIEISAG